MTMLILGVALIVLGGLGAIWSAERGPVCTCGRGDDCHGECIWGGVDERRG